MRALLIHAPLRRRRSKTTTAAPPAGARIAIVSASVGAGHDGAAAALGARLAAAGYRVDRHDLLDLVPAPAAWLLRGGYRRLLVLAPGIYQRIYAATERAGRPGPAIRAVLRVAERRLLRALPRDTAAVVSTYPLASQALGALRREGRLAVPALTYLTDFSTHPLWVAEGIDAHLAAHPVPARQARERGAADVRITGPLVGADFTQGSVADRRAARVRFELPADRPLALLVAGSWGVGNVERAAAEIRDTGVAEPVVVCGRNEALLRRLRTAGVAHAYGWVGDMPGLLRAVDVLVQNAGGLTCLEAFASGLPVASYRCIPGHGTTNGDALDEAGLALWIRRPGQLAEGLRELIDGPRGADQRAAALALFHRAAGPVEAVTALTASGRVVIPAQRPAAESADHVRYVRPGTAAPCPGPAGGRVLAVPARTAADAPIRLPADQTLVRDANERHGARRGGATLIDVPEADPSTERATPGAASAGAR